MQRRTFLKQIAFFLALNGVPRAFARSIDPVDSRQLDARIKDRLIRKPKFDTVHPGDVFLDKKLLPLLKAALFRLEKMQQIVGYANFSLLNFDDALKMGKSYAAIGEFSKQELEFLEMIFYSQVHEYGFMGEKPIKTITGKIMKHKAQKIPFTGHYLYRGKPMALYTKLQTQVGDMLLLTSGIRSVMKQFLLFLNKAADSHGNLSMASRSLAPPGYSFHGVGDFDVGQKGFGIYNFTEQFTKTDVYQKLLDLGYLKFRYERDNTLGVRFEPWHIEVA